jgi:alanyl-tRNA synthetase
MTERLYYADWQILTFTARVQRLIPMGDRTGVILDRTAFYPTGGGQPHDVGILGGLPVVDVIDDPDTDRILHILQGQPAFAVGDEVTGEVDRKRRTDFMQQHTGQHILSQAFLRVAGVETRSVHLGTETATIDLAWEFPDQELIHRAEELASQIVFEDRDVRSYLVSPEELAQFPLRKEPAVSGCARIVEIADFDWSPCGGTHARRTGEVGMIAVRGWERAKRMCRIEFVSGGRALADYRRANTAARAVAFLLTTARDDIPQKVARLLAEQKETLARWRELARQVAEIEAERMVREAPQVGTVRLVVRSFDDRTSEDVRALARALMRHPRLIALLGVCEPDAARLIFGRSSDLSLNMSDVLRSVCLRFDGRGGGAPDFAQGAIRESHRLEEALAWAAGSLGPQAS